MQCEVCGGEVFRVEKTLKRGISCDIRNIYCVECGDRYISETRLKSIRIGEDFMDIKQVKKQISDRQDAYMQNKIEKMQKLRNEQWKD